MGELEELYEILEMSDVLPPPHEHTHIHELGTSDEYEHSHPHRHAEGHDTEDTAYNEYQFDHHMPDEHLTT